MGLRKAVPKPALWCCWIPILSVFRVQTPTRVCQIISCFSALGEVKFFKNLL
jgi:hypothetical protein